MQNCPRYLRSNPRCFLGLGPLRSLPRSLHEEGEAAESTGAYRTCWACLIWRSRGKPQALLRTANLKWEIRSSVVGTTGPPGEKEDSRKNPAIVHGILILIVNCMMIIPPVVQTNNKTKPKFAMSTGCRSLCSSYYN